MIGDSMGSTDGFLLVAETPNTNREICLYLTAILSTTNSTSTVFTANPELCGEKPCDRSLGYSYVYIIT
jgi:hypothetical protein